MTSDPSATLPVPRDGGDSSADSAPAPGRRRRVRRWVRVVIVAVAVMVVVVGAAAAAYLAVKVNNAVSEIPRESSVMPTGSRPPSATTSQKTTYAPMNILLIGSDGRPGLDGQRSDTFIVMHVSADRKSVYLVSFPRDMYVTIPGYGSNRINASYSFGGTRLAVATVEALTGARIDHTVVVSFDGFVSLVDKVGPVTVDNPAASTKIIPTDKFVSYNFMTKGPITLTSGDMALAFVRERENLPRGDLDRTLRQRAFLKALALKILTPEVLANPVKLSDVIATVGSCAAVDDGMTNEVIYALAASMTGITSGDQIHLVQAPIGKFVTINKAEVEEVDVAGTAALGKALQTDTMPEFVAAHPTTEYGYTASATPSSSASASTKASAKATASTTKKK